MTNPTERDIKQSEDIEIICSRLVQAENSGFTIQNAEEIKAEAIEELQNSD